ncbi:hypothetical protein DENIS_0316 [Desulfonema ishimotonii]|uniref:4'-phosphopantetheinyl transferase domain-containing protein n=1 Tax=Desulfonema ishimotonii TaxID=45657 RepID=A0A401FQY7_9BACT|nr:4'-phosphopantetheinyl transferase superfamily protein [Desulfonema ishimotonii]GBC59377.1 hypothetical protein DENIS_0316 [Desulfonema ishimotonii]
MRLKPLQNRTDTLYPVILPVPAALYAGLPVRERVRFLSRHARQALGRSARKQGVCFNVRSFEKDDNGAPLPLGCWYWSLTHKPEYVGGVISPVPAGLDLEKIQPVSPGLFKKVAVPAEWFLLDPDRPESFFRYWTAKEAVLKATGVGLRDLLQCRVIRVVDATHLLLDYRNREWRIEQVTFGGHMAAIVKNDFNVEWVVHHSEDSSSSETGIRRPAG